MIKRSIFSLSVFLLSIFPLIAQASIDYEPDYSLHYTRENHFAESVEVTSAELRNVLQADRPYNVWEKYFHIPNLEETYWSAYNLEKDGKYAQALMLFQKIDAARVSDSKWSYSARNPAPQVIFRETQDRIELYSSARLKHPAWIAAYLAGRKSFLAGGFKQAFDLFDALSRKVRSADPKDPSGFGAVADYMAAVSWLKSGKGKAGGEGYLKFMYRHPSAKTYMTAAYLALPEEQALVPPAKAEAALRDLLRKFPQSRYADDAAYLLCSFGIAHSNWDQTREYFQQLAEKFNGDDMVIKGRLDMLASRAAEKFQKSSKTQAFWELAGATGDYEGDEQQWRKLKSFYQPYFMMASIGSTDRQGYPYTPKVRKKKARKKVLRSSRAFSGFMLASLDVSDAGDEEKREKVPIERYLTEIVEKHPKHPLRPQAMVKLIQYYMSQVQYNWQDPNKATMVEKIRVLCEWLMRDYPMDPYSGDQALGWLRWTHSTGLNKNNDLLHWMEKAHQYHDLSESKFFGLVNEVGPVDKKLPFKDDRMNEMTLVANERWEALLDQYPDSAFAPWAFLKAFNVFENTKVKPQQIPQPKRKRNLISISDQKKVDGTWEKSFKARVATLLRYSKWYLKNSPQGPQADAVRAQRAKVLLDSGDLKEALKEAQAIIAAAPGKAASKREGTDEDNGSAASGADAYHYWLDVAYWVRARAYEEMGSVPKAIEAYREFVKKYPISENGSGQATIWNSVSSLKSGSDSPYTRYAYGKLALHEESFKKYVEALKLYYSMSALGDCHTLMSSVMSVEDLLKYIKKFPNDPEIPQVQHSLGIRYFQRREYDKALVYLKGSPEEDEMKRVQEIYQKLEQKADPEEKARAEYETAQYFFHQRGTLYFDYGSVNAPVDPTHSMPNAETYALAKEGFKRVADLYPKSPYHDRALYSAALSRLHEGAHYYGELGPDLLSEAVTLFGRIARETPGSGLADDGLAWAYFFSQNEDYLTQLAQNTNHGDVLLFTNVNELQQGNTFAYWNSPVWWDSIEKHNLYLNGTDFSQVPKAFLVGSQLQNHFMSGGVYSGWYYYKVTGKSLFSTNLAFNIEGCDDSTALVNLNGQEAVLPAHAPKTFNIKTDGSTPGVAQWIYFRVNDAGDKPITVSGSAQVLVDGQTFDFPLDTVKAEPQTCRLGYATTFREANPGSLVSAAAYIDPFGRANAWAIQEGNGKTRLYHGHGKYFFGHAFVDHDVRQIIPVMGGDIYVYDLNQPLTSDKPVAYLDTNEYAPYRGFGGSMALPALAPFGRYAHGALSLSGGFLVDERGEKIAQLPKGVETGKEKVPDPKVEVKNGEKLTDSEIVISGLQALGLSEDVRYLAPGPDKILEAHFLGIDHDGKVYLYLKCALDHKIQIFHPSGKSAGLWWLKEKWGPADEFQKLKYYVFPEGKVRFYSFFPDKKSFQFEDFLCDYKGRQGYDDE